MKALQRAALGFIFGLLLFAGCVLLSGCARDTVGRNATGGDVPCTFYRTHRMADNLTICHLPDGTRCVLTNSGVYCDFAGSRAGVE